MANKNRLNPHIHMYKLAHIQRQKSRNERNCFNNIYFMVYWEVFMRSSSSSTSSSETLHSEQLENSPFISLTLSFLFHCWVSNFTKCMIWWHGVSYYYHLGINDGSQLQTVHGILVIICRFRGLALTRCVCFFLSLFSSFHLVEKLRFLPSENQFSCDKCQHLKREHLKTHSLKFGYHGVFFIKNL